VSTDAVSKRSFAATEALRHLDLAETELRRGDVGVAQACIHAATVRSMVGVMSVEDRVESEARTRLHDLQDRLGDAVRAIDPEPHIQGRIQGALTRLLGAATLDEITEEVTSRIALHEEARVQFLHALGKELVLSWPDHHARYQISDKLEEMRRDGRVRATLPMTFWRGRLWSASRP
jgi:hypothetical protein